MSAGKCRCSAERPGEMERRPSLGRTGLLVTRSGDPSEREADRVADAVIRTPDSGTGGLSGGGYVSVSDRSRAAPQVAFDFSSIPIHADAVRDAAARKSFEKLIKKG